MGPGLGGGGAGEDNGYGVVVGGSSAIGGGPGLVGSLIGLIGSLGCGGRISDSGGGCTGGLSVRIP